jgi:hypothetical protein
VARESAYDYVSARGNLLIEEDARSLLSQSVAAQRRRQILISAAVTERRLSGRAAAIIIVRVCECNETHMANVFFFVTPMREGK